MARSEEVVVSKAHGWVLLVCLLGLGWACEPGVSPSEPGAEPPPESRVGLEAGPGDSGGQEAGPELRLPPEGRSTEPASDATTPDGGTPDGGTPDGDACGIPPKAPEAGAIRTERGWVLGRTEGQVRIFQGIPYAAPPLKGLRWKPPQPHACWTDLRKTQSFGAACIQIERGSQGTLKGQEDCLTLNVWSPAQATPQNPAAVMFFIHGGGNVIGSTSETLPGGKHTYNGLYLAQTMGVVVVSINYRLGALGYLALPQLSQESPRKSSGNYGILDQIFALKWVKGNIQNFGGDPQKVMIFGESAGAVNTCVHVASPLSKGLFHAALMQSGVCHGPAQLNLKRAESVGLLRLAKTQCKDASDPIACLRNKPVEALLKEMPSSVQVGRLTDKQSLEEFGPIVDGYVLPTSPLEAMKAKTHNDVPFVIGSNQDEMDNLLVTPVPTAEAYEKLVRSLLQGLVTDVDAVLKLYDAKKYPTPRAAMVDLVTDVSFTCNAYEVSQLLSASQSSKVYRYFYTRQATSATGATTPARHGIELLYVFRTLTDIALYRPSSDDLKLADGLMAYWSQLAKAGDPNGSGKVTWEPYDASKDNTLIIDSPPTMQNGARQDRCRFWAKILKP